MLNLGICKKCPNCKSFSPALLAEDGKRVRESYADCSLVASSSTVLGWRSDVPDKCPYVLEHKMTEEAVADLGLEDEDEPGL